MKRNSWWDVSEGEINDARDAIVAHAKKWGRDNDKVLAVFEETIRQLRAYMEKEAKK